MLTKILGLLSVGLPKITTVPIVKRTLAGGTGATSIQKLTKVPLGQTLNVDAYVFATGVNRGFVRVNATVKNIAGTTGLVGAATQVAAHRDGASIAVTLVANNTDDTLDLQVTADAANATTFTGFAVVTPQP